MRTTAVDLIKELTTESIGSKMASLVVRFENTTLFVYAHAKDPLSELNEIIKNGGEPIGVIRMAQNRDLSVTVRPLEEYAEDDWVCQYLVSLAQTLREQLSARCVEEDKS